jgi:hypothetical protein
MPVDRNTSNLAKIAFRALELRRPVTYQTTDEAVLALEDHYAHAITATLEAADWGFASRIAVLEVETGVTEIDPRLPNAFLLPSDCGVIREVVTEGVAWRRDWTWLRADTADDITIRYTLETTTEAVMPAQFLEAAALRLAILMAPSFLEVQSKAARIQDAFDAAIRRATRTDAQTASASSYGLGLGSSDWSGEATL